MSVYKMILSAVVEINEECSEDDKNTVLKDKTAACKAAAELLQDHWREGKIMVQKISFKRIKENNNGL